MNIAIDHVDMTYPTGKKALAGVCLNLASPNLIGLLGPNGAGKTTLMKLLVAGLLPTGGRIALDGAPLIQQEKRLKSRLGYLPQSFGLYDELTVSQFLSYMCALKGIRDSKRAVAEAMEAVRLTDKRRARIRTLSGGQRQRVGVAQALLGKPELLILDEPTVGLDPEERVHFRNLFSAAAQDKIVVLSTHIIEDVQSICNRLIVIHEGHILFDGAPEALIAAAQGHVGMFFETREHTANGTYQITSRLNTARGVCCRIVAETLPPFAEPAEPTLEDAYLYRIGKGADTE